MTEGESRGLTPTERGTRGWRRGEKGGEGLAGKGGAGGGRREKEGGRRKNGIRLNGEV